MILYEMDGASTIQGFFLTKFQSIKLNRNQKIKTQCSGTFFLEKICKNINKTQNYMFKNSQFFPQNSSHRNYRAHLNSKVSSVKKGWLCTAVHF